jgi:hypothetical protein
LNTASAAGERQMFPRQTKSIPFFAPDGAISAAIVDLLEDVLVLFFMVCFVMLSWRYKDVKR